jgi:bacillithiol biosynthesis deacetylase BshB1
MSTDLLVFGPHPDDAEIGLGATIAKHTAAGHTVGICDLSAGELGSNGTTAERRAEADAAARVLGVAWRVNLGWPDGAMRSTPELVRSAAALIRRRQPRAIAIPYWEDRHPDHVDASATLTDAVFKSRLRRFDVEGEPWHPEWACYYFINDGARPSFVVDVSDHYAKKREALACYRSQFAPAGAGAVSTRLTMETFTRLIESRDMQFGALAGVAFAEGLVVREPIVRSTVLKSRP